MLKVQQLSRVFVDGGVELRDPLPGAELTKAIQVLAMTGRPHLLTAEIRGPEQVDDKMVYTLHRSVGTKGSVGAQPNEKSLEAVRSYGGPNGALQTKLPSAVATAAKCLVGNKGEKPMLLPSEALPWTF